MDWHHYHPFYRSEAARALGYFDSVAGGTSAKVVCSTSQASAVIASQFTSFKIPTRECLQERLAQYGHRNGHFSQLGLQEESLSLYLTCFLRPTKLPATKRASDLFDLCCKPRFRRSVKSSSHLQNALVLLLRNYSESSAKVWHRPITPDLTLVK